MSSSTTIGHRRNTHGAQLICSKIVIRGIGNGNGRTEQKKNERISLPQTSIASGMEAVVGRWWIIDRI